MSGPLEVDVGPEAPYRCQARTDPRGTASASIRTSRTQSGSRARWRSSRTCTYGVARIAAWTANPSSTTDEVVDSRRVIAVRAIGWRARMAPIAEATDWASTARSSRWAPRRSFWSGRRKDTAHCFRRVVLPAPAGRSAGPWSGFPPESCPTSATPGTRLLFTSDEPLWAPTPSARLGPDRHGAGVSGAGPTRPQRSVIEGGGSGLGELKRAKAEAAGSVAPTGAPCHDCSWAVSVDSACWARTMGAGPSIARVTLMREPLPSSGRTPAR